MRGLLRVWKEFDLKDIEKYLLVIGELSSECFSCHNIGIDSKVKQCPHCKIIFKYIGFRRVVNINYLERTREEHPQVIFIDFEDFKKALGKQDAKKILNI